MLKYLENISSMDPIDENIIIIAEPDFGSRFTACKVFINMIRPTEDNGHPMEVPEVKNRK